MNKNLQPQNIKPALNVKEISDQYVRKNFQNLAEYFATENQLQGFKFFEVVFSEETDTFTLNHNLGAVPQDIIMLNCVGDGDLVVNFGVATTKTITMSSSGAVRARFFLGTYWNYKSTYNFTKTDAMTFNAVPSQTFVTQTTNVINNVTIITGSSTAAPITPGTLAQLDSSGGAFTQVLPLASSASGVQLLLKKRSSDLNIITLACSGTDTINGSAVTTTLATQDEYLVLTPVGGGWVIASRWYPQGWVPYPSTAIGQLILSSGTAPSYGTIAQNKAFYRRIGNMCVVNWSYRQTGVGANGTGFLLITTPGKMNIDASFIPATSDTTHLESSVGHLDRWINGSSQGIFIASVFTTSHATLKGTVCFIGGGYSSSNTTSVAGASLAVDFTTAGAMSYHAEFQVPIVGWSQ